MGVATGIHLKREGTLYDDALVAEVSSVIGAGLVNVYPGSEQPSFKAIVEEVACHLWETGPSFDSRFAAYEIELALSGTRDDEHRVRLAKRFARKLEEAGFDVIVEDEMLDIVDHRAPDVATPELDP